MIIALLLDLIAPNKLLPLDDKFEQIHQHKCLELMVEIQKLRRELKEMHGVEREKPGIKPG